MIKNQKLPSFFKPILWSYDFPKLDVWKDKKTIIINTINYGDLKHWRWLIKIYDLKRIRSVIKKVPFTEMRPRVLQLASLIFNIKDFNHAPRGIKAD